MADYSFVKDHDGNILGLWLRDPSQAQDQNLLIALMTKHGYFDDFLADGYHVEPNIVDNSGGCFVMFGSASIQAVAAPANSPEETIEMQLEAQNRPQWGRIFAWIGLGLLLLILFLGLLRAQEGPVAVGKRAPDFTLTSFDGQEYRLSDLRGKVVVLNFWASWCKPCEQEAADLEAAWRYYQGQGDGVVFLGVAYTDTEKNALEYLEKFDITYPNGPDLGTRISQAYRITGVPETYIIDRDGVLAYARLSPFLSLDEILAGVEAGR
jgi:cytochrome c biogenesis protein CcmG/thiol:disulfide interchange protein DsbE